MDYRGRLLVLGGVQVGVIDQVFARFGKCGRRLCLTVRLPDGTVRELSAEQSKTITAGVR